MNNYQLQSNEMVIVECEDVTLDNNAFITKTGNLVLTNRNLIWAIKSTFGRIKDIKKYPLSIIKIYEGQIQMIIEEKFGEPAKLHIYLKNEQINFTSSNKEKIRELAQKANKLLTGNDFEGTKSASIPGASYIADTLKGTVDTFKNAFGIKPKAPEIIASKCTGCGANISGIKGQAVRCPYCENMQNV